MSMNERDLGRLLIEDLAQVVGALGGGTASVGTGAAPEGPQWTITVASEGAVRAACVLAIDHAGAAAIATAVVEKDDDAAIEGVLRDVGLDWPLHGPLEHYMHVCPRCRRRHVGLGQGQAMAQAAVRRHMGPALGKE